MIWEREIRIEGNIYSVVISDQRTALLAAKAAGRAVVGLLTENNSQELSGIRYLVETVQAADDGYLERIVRREKGMPWIIGESSRLLLREFIMGDERQVLPEPEDEEADSIFYCREKLKAYIRSQYGFFEHGLWAIVRKADGKILGKAGVTAGEAADEGMFLAYHVFGPYRRRGYAWEACRMVLDYVEREYKSQIFALVRETNEASRRLLEKLGFVVKGQRYNESGHPYILYVRNC